MKINLLLLTAAIALTPSLASAYHFSLQSDSAMAWDIKVHTASFFCKNRHPVKHGSPDANRSTVRGSTAPGCLISKVVYTTPDGNRYSATNWYPGGWWNLQDFGFGLGVYCYDSQNNRCNIFSPPL